MRLFGRRERPPADLLALLEPGERLVSWADTADGAVVAASSHGLWWPEPGGLRRMDWYRVDKVVWNDGIMSVTEADIEDDLLLVDRPVAHARLTVPRDLPPDRPQAGGAEHRRAGTAQRHRGIGAVRGAEAPGRDGVYWWARLEPGTPDTARLRSAVRNRLEILRSS